MDQRGLARSALANLRSSFKKARVRSKDAPKPAAENPLEGIKAALEEADAALAGDDISSVEIEVEAPADDEPKETILQSYGPGSSKPSAPQAPVKRGRGRPRKVM